MKRTFGSVVLLVLLIAMLTSCGLQVPRPKVKSGEFDFSITYEFNDEIHTVSGVYACKYAGTYWTLDGGYHRDWSGYTKGYEEEMVKIGTTEDGGEIALVFGFYPDYFMGDSVPGVDESPVPYISITLVDDEGMTIIHLPDEVEAKCGAKIISYEYDPPIENTFSLFNF